MAQARLILELLHFTTNSLLITPSPSPTVTQALRLKFLPGCTRALKQSGTSSLEMLNKSMAGKEGSAPRAGLSPCAKGAVLGAWLLK